MATRTIEKPAPTKTPTKSKPPAQTRRTASAKSEATSLSAAEPQSGASKPSRSPASSRSIWRGAISFGMVSIPVKLYPATASKDVSFNLLHAKCNSRLRQLKWCPVCDREVKADEIVRGFEYSKDRYIRVTDEDLEKLPIPSKHTIELAAFVKAEQIDPIYYEKSYYLQPEPAGRKSFALLMKALEEKELTAVARVALREKERLCAVRVSDSAMVLETLFYADEIRAAHTEDTGSVAISDRELDMAYQLIDYLSVDFDPEKYKDEYRETLLALLEGKQESSQAVSSPAAPAEREDNVIDLMAALKASLEAAQGASAAEPDKPEQPARRRRKAA